VPPVSVTAVDPTTATRPAVALALGLLLVGCTATVSGTPVAQPEPVPAGARTQPDPGRAPAPPRSALTADVVADECLLDPAQLGDLLGRPVGEPARRTLPGTAGSACWAFAREDPAAPLVAINVYRPRTGTPAEFVRAAPAGDRRELSGAGEAAVILDTDTGPTLQLAAGRYVVTVVVIGTEPPDGAWRAAAGSVLADLPG
jgi:hypothetical protein